MSVEYRYDIFDPPSGKSRIVCVHDKITMDELSALLRASFDRPILGLTDENKILYPLSVITNDPSLLATRTELVTVGAFNGEGNQNGNNLLVRQNAVADLMNPEGEGEIEGDTDDDEEDTNYEEIDEYVAGKAEDELYNQRPLSLEESIEEMNLLVGFGSVDVRTVLELLLPSQSRPAYNGADDWLQSLPLCLSREDFLELVRVLASLVHDSSSDEELINLLFDVLYSPSDILLDIHKDSRLRSASDEIDLTTLASGLTLLCSGDESANLAVVFSLCCKRDNLVAGSGRNVVPDVCVYLHLSACFRLAYQLCSALRKSAESTPEELAYTYSLGQFADMRDREYDDGFLSFREFDLCCKRGFRQGLLALHESMYVAEGLGRQDGAIGNEMLKDEILQVERLPSYEQESKFDEHPPSYEDSHHHDSLLPEYEDTYAHKTVLPVPPVVTMAGLSGAQPPQPPRFEGGSPQMYIHDHSLYRSYLQPDAVTSLGGVDMYEAPLPTAPAMQSEEGDDDHDAHFVHGELGKHYFHHNEVSSEESDSVEDHHFPHAKHGEDFHFMDRGSAGDFFRRGVEGTQRRQISSTLTGGEEVSAEEDDANALEDSLVAASLVEYDGGPIDVLKAQQILGFKVYQPDVILSSLLYAATDDGDVSLSSYHRLFDQLMRKRYSSLSVLQRSVADYIVSQIFDTFDNVGKGHIKMEELGWSLLIFSDGAPGLKARAATALMNSHVDTDLQGGLRAGDMIYCLNSVLKTVCALNKEFVAPMHPEQIAEELTICAFQHAGANYLNDDSIDVEDAAQYWQEVNSGSVPSSIPSMIPVMDFEHWFGVVISQFEFEGAMALPSDASLVSNTSPSVGSSSNADTMSIPRLDSEPEMNSYGGLYSDASELRSSLESATSDGSSAMGAWKRKLMIDTEGAEDEETEDDEAYDESAQTSEDESALAAVYPEEKFLNFSDYPEFAGMDDSVTSGSRADASASNSDMPSQSQSDYEEINTDPSSGYDSESTMGEEGSSAVTIEMRSAASLLGLDGFPADDLMEVLGEASKNNVLRKDRWLASLSYMVQLAGGSSPRLAMASKLGERLYDAFQTGKGGDADDGVSYPEFAAGLTVLCSGCSLQDKVMVAFTLVDSDSDGLVDIQELRGLVLAMLRVMVVCSQVGRAKVESTKASLETMATVIVKEAYNMFQLHPSEQVNTEIVHEMCSDYVMLATGARPEDSEDED